MAVSHRRQSEAEKPGAAQKCRGFKSQHFQSGAEDLRDFCIATLCVRSLKKLVLTPTKGYHSSKTEGLSGGMKANKQKAVSSTTSLYLGGHHISGGSLCSNNQIKKFLAGKPSDLCLVNSTCSHDDNQDKPLQWPIKQLRLSDLVIPECKICQIGTAQNKE